jgi:predicted P-loop ATPase
LVHSTPGPASGQRKPFKGDFRCPVCKGAEDDERGQGTRCHGYLTPTTILCTREDHAGRAPYIAGSSAYQHKAKGPCPCGKEHAPADKKAKEIDRVYKYHDADGKVVHETVRYKNPKKFSQRRPGPNGREIWNLDGVTTVLYHLPELLTADPMRTVWICEGEKDADRLRVLGQIATTSPMGAGKWRNHYSDALTDRIVWICPHNDQAGRDHAQQAAQSLQGKAISVKIVEPPGVPEKGDVSDFLDAGGTLEQLIALGKAAPEWTAQVGPKPSTNGVHQVGADPDFEVILNRDRKWTSCLHNSLLWLERNGHAKTVRYDRFRQVIMVKGESLEDRTVISLNAEIEADRRTAWVQDHLRSALVQTAHRNAYSSQTEWLDSLVWDGTERLDGFFWRAYATEATAYAAACSKVLFLSGVARAYQPGCQADVMVVMIGGQGLGKSMGIARLCPDPAWYADDLGCDLFDRKAGEGLRGKWLIEFSEFSRINRATLDVAKAFVSRRSDYYRPAYARMHKDFPRTCIFVGTTNDDHPLQDRENRRFMPIRCKLADSEWITENRDQLWAEAVARYRKGEQWWVAGPTSDPTLAAQIAEQAEGARQGDSWEEILEQELGHSSAISMRDAAGALKIGIDRLDKSTQTRIGLALKAIGYIRDRVRNQGSREYQWKRPVAPRVPAF